MSKEALTERVARAIREAQGNNGMPKWDELDSLADLTLKAEIRAMAVVAIKAVSEGAAG